MQEVILLLIQALAYACKLTHADTGHLHLLYAVLSKRSATIIHSNMRTLSPDRAAHHAFPPCMCCLETAPMAYAFGSNTNLDTEHV